MQYGIKEVMNFTIANYHPDPFKRKPLVSVDYAQMTDIENGAERIDISGGRGNKKLLSFDHSKSTTINVTLPLVDIRLLALISGDCVKERLAQVFKREVLPVIEDGGKYYVTLSHKAIGASLYVNELDGNRDIGNSLTSVAVPATVDTGEYELAVDGLKIEVNADLDGKELVVYYHTQTTKKVENLQINPERFPKAISIYGDTLFRNQYTELDEIYNVVGHKGRIRPNYTLSMNASDVTVLELTIDLYAYKDLETRQEIYLEYIKDESEPISNDCNQE